MTMRKKIFVSLSLMLLVFAALIGLAPTLVNLGLGQGAMHDAIAAKVNGHVDLGTVRVGWFGPQRIEGLQVVDQAGRQVARLDLENLRVQSAARLGGYPRT